MDLKKKIKGFFTLTRKANSGFTLVELIVVIAILAILGGVAVPAYSGYVTKANKQADMTLTSDVAHALSLYYYNNGSDITGGYVVLTEEGQSNYADEVGSAAMVATFGEGWEETLNLKYSEWNVENELLDEILGYSDTEIEAIVNSSYVTDCSSAGLMKTVTGLTNLVGDVIREKSIDRDKARSNLTTLFGEDSAILKQLDQLEKDGLTADDYPTAISNLLVNTMASTVETEPYLQAMMNQYAAAYAYGEKTGDWKAFEKMKDTLSNVSMSELSTEGEYAADLGKFKMWEGMTAIDEATGDEVYLADYQGFLTYIEDTGVDQVANDEAALSSMMGAVKKISDRFVNVDSVTNSDLYSTDEVSVQLNEYLNAVKTVKNMKDSGKDLNNLSDGVMAIIASDGTVSVSPSVLLMQD